MILEVTNREVKVGEIRAAGVSSSSVLFIGDANEIILSSFFDSFPEVIEPVVPLPSLGD
ncbi:MAG TPA: spore gernimation protein GerPD [Bacilli bacterium]